jgi:GxxExxY protein
MSHSPARRSVTALRAGREQPIAHCFTRRRGQRPARAGNCILQRGLRVDSQVGIDFTYDGLDFKDGFRLDLLVERCVILEVKCIERGLAPVHTKQLLTYLRLTDLQIGLLLNFGGATMKEGIKRVVNDLSPSDSPGLRVNQVE